MTNRIRPLTESSIDAFVEIMAGAYPGLKIVTESDRRQLRDRLVATFEDPSATIYGLSDRGQLLAGMILYDFTMNVRGTLLPAGGLGSLAVDLVHRKQRLAKEMVTFYLEHYRNKAVPIALLYPFRPDFYRRMGFGYGAKMNKYIVRPDGFRVSKFTKSHIEYLGKSEVDRVLACYDRYAATTHGMILGSSWRLKQMLTNPALRTVGYVDHGEVLGYLAFDFVNRGHFLKNDLRIKQLIWQGPAVLAELLAFVASLSDQFDWVVFSTQDQTFHHLLDDPRSRANDLLPSVYHESNTQGVGLMYRAIDPRLVFSAEADIAFGPQDITLKFTLEDTFVSSSGRSLIVHFQDGRATQLASEEFEVEIRMDISDFSSMIMGAITFEQLTAYGLAHVSEVKRLRQISDLFATRTEPICMTAF